MQMVGEVALYFLCFLTVQLAGVEKLKSKPLEIFWSCCLEMIIPLFQSRAWEGAAGAALHPVLWMVFTA